MPARTVDFYCPVCLEILPHIMDDPGASHCPRCGRTQVLMSPLNPS